MAIQYSNLDRIPKAFMTPSTYINGLPRVSCADLPVDKNDRRCSICLQEYMVGREGEVALKLPCGHLFVSKFPRISCALRCLKQCLSSFRLETYLILA